MTENKRPPPPPKPALPVLQILALDIHSFAFWYIPKLPMRFNRDFTAINLSKSPTQCCFVAISITNLLLHGLLSGLVALHYVVFKQSNQNFGWEKLIMLAIVFYSFVGSALFGYSVLRIRHCLVHSLNDLFQMKLTLVLSGDIRECSRDPDGYGNAMLLTVLIGGGFPIAFTLAALYMSYDAAQYVLEKVLIDPMYWDTKTVYYTLGLRAILLFTAGVEIARSGSYFLCCFFLFTDNCTKVSECMKKLRFPVFAYLYTIFRIMYCRIRTWFHWFMYLLEIAVFWSTVLTSYCVIMCYDRVTLVIFLGAIIGLFACVMIQVTLLPDAIDTIVLIKSVLEIQRTEVKTILAQKKSRVNWKYLKIAMAIHIITVLCGLFKIIDRVFLRERFDLLAARIFDAILLF